MSPSVSVDAKVCCRCLVRKKSSCHEPVKPQAPSPQATISDIVPITSTPIHSRNSSPSHMFVCSHSRSSSPITIDSKSKSKSTNSDSDKLKSVARSNEQSTSNKPRSSKCFWSDEETYLIYMGMQKNLSWIQIKNKYFRNSKRTNLTIRDRWRTISSKQELMDRLKEKYALESSS